MNTLLKKALCATLLSAAAITSVEAVPTDNWERKVAKMISHIPTAVIATGIADYTYSTATGSRTLQIIPAIVHYSHKCLSFTIPHGTMISIGAAALLGSYYIAQPVIQGVTEGFLTATVKNWIVNPIKALHEWANSSS